MSDVYCRSPQQVRYQCRWHSSCMLTEKKTVGSDLYLVYPYEVNVLHMLTDI